MLRDIIGHDSVKSKLIKIKSPPKVMLFSGPDGVGKKYTALHFIDELNHGLLTKKLFLHPDIYILDSFGSTFKLELIEKIKNNIYSKPFELSYKFFILNNVEKMNKESANACLKIFEECPDHVYFILITDNITHVIDTIKSRAVIFNFDLINNLSDYYPKLSQKQIKILDGRIGYRDLIEGVDVDNLYNNFFIFFSNFNSHSYSDIIEWCVKNSNLDLKLFLKVILEVSKELDNYYLKENLVNFLKNIQIKTSSSIDFKTHFKNGLIQLKYNISKIN
jgi:DNA polymerase-3 subunit delta'